jgi:hypothetical protein
MQVNVPALRLLAQMRQQSGEHWECVRLVDEAMKGAKEEQVCDACCCLDSTAMMLRAFLLFAIYGVHIFH